MTRILNVFLTTWFPNKENQLKFLGKTHLRFTLYTFPFCEFPFFPADGSVEQSGASVQGRNKLGQRSPSVSA